MPQLFATHCIHENALEVNGTTETDIKQQSSYRTDFLPLHAVQTSKDPAAALQQIAVRSYSPNMSDRKALYRS
jgi:hypothetical protein